MVDPFVDIQPYEGSVVVVEHGFRSTTVTTGTSIHVCQFQHHEYEHGPSHVLSSDQAREQREKSGRLILPDRMTATFTLRL